MPADIVRYDTERGRRGSTLLIALGVDLIVVVAVAVPVPGRALLKRDRSRDHPCRVMWAPAPQRRIRASGGR
jgi:hypothetical protein